MSLSCFSFLVTVSLILDLILSISLSISLSLFSETTKSRLLSSSSFLNLYSWSFSFSKDFLYFSNSFFNSFSINLVYLISILSNALSISLLNWILRLWISSVGSISKETTLKRSPRAYPWLKALENSLLSFGTNSDIKTLSLARECICSPSSLTILPLFSTLAARNSFLFLSIFNLIKGNSSAFSIFSESNTIWVWVNAFAPSKI